MSLLVIDGRPIQQDAAGRYNLNVMHRASGGEQRHRPNYWLDLESTRELIAEIQAEQANAGKPADESNQPFAVRPGAASTGGGTFVAIDLVFDYARWISPKFALKVYRAARAHWTSSAVADVASNIVHRDQSSFADASIASRVMLVRKQLIPILAGEADTVQLALPFDFGPALTPAVRKRLNAKSSFSRLSPRGVTAGSRPLAGG